MKTAGRTPRWRPGLSLKVRFALIIAGAIVLLGIANRVYLERRVLGEMERDLDNKTLAMARYLAAESVDLVLYQDVVRLEELLEKFVASDPGFVYAFIVDPAHTVMVHTFKGPFPEGLRLINRLAPGEQYRERHVSVLGQNYRDFAVDIHRGQLGVLRLGVSDRQILARIAQVRRDMLIMMAVVIVLGAAGAYLFTGILLRPLGRVVAALETFRPGVYRDEIPAGHDEIGAVAARINEVTARLHETHQQMMRTERLVAVGQLAAGVAHEINNPLSGAMHCIENLRADDADEAGRRQYYGLMADGIARAQRVVKSLLELGRQHPPDMRPVNLNAVVQKALALVEAPLGRSGVDLRASLAPSLPPVPADPHEIEQAVINLLLNAMEATPAGGTVTVATAHSAGHCRVSVRDTGPGIPVDLRARVFDPFFTTKGAQGGSGLGLSVTLGVVERHGGRIEIGDASGGGAVVEIALPVLSPPSGGGGQNV